VLPSRHRLSRAKEIELKASKVTERRRSVSNKEHVALLKQGVAAWNEWRLKNPDIRPDLWEANLGSADLSAANLEGAYLGGANLGAANLSAANLEGAYLAGATLTIANLTGANLSGANLIGADLTRAKLSGAKLIGADLNRAKFIKAGLTRANLTEALLAGTVFGDIDLTRVIGLETCNHSSGSIIDYQTLARSGPLPLSFLRGVGLPDNFIEYLPSLLNQAIQHYSCFISYSTKDQEFAERLHEDLQNKGVRCWFAPHALRVGDKILDEIDAAIRSRDKVLLILSEHSINSKWVKDEVYAGFEEERKRGQIVLFPVRLDEAVMKTNEAWAAQLRARLIGDFQHWKDHNAYKRSFERIVRDLTKLAPSSSRP
jgi:hypothetical protein